MLSYWKRARNSRALAARKCTELFNTLGATGTLQFQHAPEVEVLVRGGRLYIVAPLDSEEFRELLNKEAEHLVSNSVEAVASTAKAVLERPDALEELLEETPRPYVFQRLTEEA